MKKSARIILPLLIGSLVFSGCEKKEEPQAKENITSVEVQELESTSMQKTVSYAGKIAANQTVNVTSKASGKVKTIMHDVGDYVKKGDVLFTIDTKDIEDQIAQLEASLQVSQASVNTAQTALSQSTDGGQAQTAQLQLEKAVENAQKSMETAQIAVDNSNVAIENARASVATAKASYDDYAKKYNDYKTMYDGGVISKSDFDAIELAYTTSKNSYDQVCNSLSQAENGLISAQNQYEQAQNAYNQAKDSLDIYLSKTKNDNRTTAANGVRSAEAGRNSVQTQINILRSNLPDYTVTSPISGVISERNLEETNMVSAAAVPFVITDTQTVTVDVNVSEKIINNIKVGDTTKVTLSSEDDTLTGKIKTINTVADSTGTYAVQVSVENKDGKLKPGMFANISFVSQQSDNTIVVPINTVIEKNDKKYVFTVTDNVANLKEVTTGLDDGNNIEITSGIETGEKVVVKGQSYLDDKEKVNVVSSGEAK